MSKLIKIDSDLKMTSREIAELVESRHDSVKRTVERLMSAGAVSSSTPLVDFKNSNNVTGHEFLLSKRDSYVVVAQLSPQFTARLVDRWQELEQQNKQPVIPQTYAEALRLAADQAEQLALAAPKVSYYDKVVERDTLLNATQVGQKMGLSAVILNRHLDEIGVYNKAIKRGRAFRQSFVDAGHGIMRQTETGHAQPLFTLLGEAWVIEKLTSEGIV